MSTECSWLLLGLVSDLGSSDVMVIEWRIIAIECAESSNNGSSEVEPLGLGYACLVPLYQFEGPWQLGARMCRSLAKVYALRRT